MKPSTIISLFIMGMALALCLFVKRPEPPHEAVTRMIIDAPPPFEIIYMGWTNSFTNFDEAARFAPSGAVINIPNGKWDIVTNIAPEILTPKEGRVLSELTAELGPGEALRVFNRTKEAANIERSTRPPMPGVRTNLDLKRFPLFEEAP